MRLILGVAAVAAGLALLASANAQDASNAHLVSVPDAASLSDHFPVAALARGVSGRAVLSCAVAADGSSQCTAAEETPAGSGFGAAAVSLAQGWRFTPRLENGQAVASTVRLPIVFQNPTPSPAPIAPDINVDGSTGPTNLAASTHDLGRFYPERARRSYANGRALVACAVRSGPRLECALERESPNGWGFGDAAVNAATAAMSGQRLRVGDRTRVTVDFALRNPRGQPPLRNYWEAQPSGAEWLRYYPGPALDSGHGGVAMLNCLIQTDRSLSCTKVSETPRDSGFGDAALQLSRSYRLSSSELGRPGHSAGDHIILPIVFALHQ